MPVLFTISAPSMLVVTPEVMIGVSLTVGNENASHKNVNQLLPIQIPKKCGQILVCIRGVGVIQYIAPGVGTLALGRILVAATYCEKGSS